MIEFKTSRNGTLITVAEEKIIGIEKLFGDAAYLYLEGLTDGLILDHTYDEAVQMWMDAKEKKMLRKVMAGLK